MTDSATIKTLWSRADRMRRRVREIEDRAAIYRLFIDLQNAMDGRDLVRYGSLFTEDGEWSGVSGRVIGPARIAEFLSQYCKPWESPAQRTYHSISDVSIDLDGDRATVRGQWRHDHPGDNGQPVTVHFGYFDAMVQRTPDGWRIKRQASYGILPYIPPKFQLIGLAEADAHGDCMPTSPADVLTVEQEGRADDAGIQLLRERLDQMDQSVREAADRDAIYRLFIDLQSAMDGRDLVKYGSFYTDDGEWCAVNGRAIGPATIAKHLSQYCKPWESQAQRTYHSISDVSIDLDGDRATARGQWQHNHPGDNGQPVTRHFGHFEAILLRTPDGWRLRRRASYVELPYIEPEYQLIALAEADAEGEATIGKAGDGERRHMPASPPHAPGAKENGMADAREIRALDDRLDQLEERVHEVEDRAAIYRLFIELQAATDGRDGVKYGQCFTEDGEWSGMNGRAVGRAEITAFMSKYLTPWESEELRTYHSFSDLSIDLHGDMATARAQYRHIKLGDDGHPVAFHFCHYDAILQRTSAGWLFKRRASYVDLPFVEPKFQLIGTTEAEAQA